MRMGLALGLASTNRSGGSGYEGMSPQGLSLLLSTGAPALTQAHSLAPSGISVAPSVGSPAVDETNAFTLNGLSVTSSVGSPALTQLHSLSPASISAAPSVGNPALTSTAADTTAPVVNSISYTAPDLTVDLTEASGTATAVWATADPSEDPTFTVVGGWSGTTYETGSFTVTSGGDTDTIAITGTTPDGARELSLYFYDASNNLSTVERVAITVDNTAPIPSAVSGTQTGATTATWAATSDEAGGTMYAAAWPAASADPSAAQIIAGTGGSIVAADTDATPTADSANAGSFTGLTASTEYQVGVVHVDAAGNESALAVSAGTFTTAAAGGNPIPARLLATPYTDSSESSATHNTANVTPTGGRPVVILVHAQNGSTAAMSFTSATFAGGSVTPVASQQDSRVHIFAFVVENPAAVSTNFAFTLAEIPRSLVVEILEITDGATSGTLGNILTGANGTGTSAAVSGTTSVDGSLALYALTRRYNGETITPSGMDANLSQQTSGDTSVFRDVDTMIGWEVVATAGAAAGDFAWLTAEDFTAIGIELEAA